MKRQNRVCSSTDGALEVLPPIDRCILATTTTLSAPINSTNARSTPTNSTLGTASSSMGRGMRGNAKCKKLSRITPGSTLLVRIRGGDAVGSNAHLFTSYVGMVVRSHVPLWTTDFRMVSEEMKQSIIREVAQQFS